jgi:dienelactone hydrolase
MRNRFWKTILFIGLSLLIALTLSISLQLELPTPGGPLPVGRTIFRWVDPSRPEVLTDDPNDFREVVAFVWYPAEQGTGTSARYFPDIATVSKALIQSGEVEWWEVVGLRLIRSKSNLDAEPVKDQSPFPVVLFSPGNGTNIEFYSSLAIEIASHGYIVVGINHPHDVAAVELSNGNIAPYDKVQWSLDAKAHQAYTAERIKVRTADMLFVLDQLEILNSNVTSPFSGLLDLNFLAAAGHSLGGITASEACKADARFKACLNFDGLQRGGPFSMDESAIPPEQPFLFLTKESQLPPKVIEKFESTSESYWVVIHGASHENFTDGPSLQPSLLPIPNQADRFMGLIQQYTLAFLDRTLKEQPDNLLSIAIDQEDVTIHTFPSR